jgi:5-methylcytosine-specific restriction endonuclease McrA
MKLESDLQNKPCRNGHINSRRYVNGRCVECAKAAGRRKYLKHRDSVKAKSSRYYHENKEQVRDSRKAAYERDRERIREQRRINKVHRRDYYRNREVIIKRMREYKLRNKDRLFEYAKQYRERHPEVKAITESKRRARRRLVTIGEVTAADIRKMCLEQNSCCKSCGKSFSDGYHIDHIVPISRGGPHAIANLQLLCPRCNMRKGCLMPDEWANRLIELNNETNGGI